MDSQSEICGALILFLTIMVKIINHTNMYMFKIAHGCVITAYKHHHFSTSLHMVLNLCKFLTVSAQVSLFSHFVLDCQ